MENTSKLMNIILFLVLIIICCSGNKWQGKKKVKNGVTYIENPQKALWDDSKKLILKKIIAIGIEDGDENYILGRIDDIDVDYESRIYITDFKSNCIKIYNNKGLYLRTIGRKGQGPSELSGPIRAKVNSNGNLFVLEVGTRRISIFSSKGEFISSFHYGSFSPVDMIIDKKTGHIFITANITTHPFSIYKEKLNHVIYQYNITGKLIKSFCEPPIIGKADEKRNQYAVSNLTMSHNSYIYSSFAYPYVIRKYNISGKLKEVITRDSPLFKEPIPVLLGNNFNYWYSLCDIVRLLSLPDGKFIILICERGNDYLENFKKNDPGQSLKSLAPPNFYYDVYNSEGQYLKSYLVGTGEPLIKYIDSFGYAYRVSQGDQIPIVEKCAIAFE